MTHRAPRFSGFTLIELLAAIGIIAVLAALIFPMVKSARLSGQQAQTLANMRSIGTALHSYVADNDGKLPGPSTVAVFNLYLTGIHSPGATPSGFEQYLGSYLEQKPAPWVPAAMDFVHVPALDFPVLNLQARATRGVAQYVKLDYGSSSADNRFGDSAGTMADAATRPVQPKRMAALTDLARRSAILTTADKQSWQSAQNTLLPDKGAFGGKRLYLFLDGSVEGPIDKGPTVWAR
jgi:prepilin-type N-terminal cleavage/methylation domain-containing protein